MCVWSGVSMGGIYMYTVYEYVSEIVCKFVDSGVMLSNVLMEYSQHQCHDAALLKWITY